MQANLWVYGWAVKASTWRWTAGMFVWAVGASINVLSDYHLIDLRRKHGQGYHKPSAGLFRLVSAPNLFGEIVEWLGYAMACHHVAAYAFAIFTFCNLAPRALQHHEDYSIRFGTEFTKGRKALIPFVL
jgi:steroid 5-alpha reductase family enzyme